MLLRHSVSVLSFASMEIFLFVHLYVSSVSSVISSSIIFSSLFAQLGGVLGENYPMAQYMICDTAKGL
ncbi:hypothetical protein BZA05DRAFT_381171, partial [Tricharina praecox]|uniref:uncharacterized protein n=1 Tax=Tricharina praecox TaxID=43433 RepID=UPI0022211F20